VATGFGSDFKRFWAGQTVSQLGSSFTAFATPLLVYKLTHSAVNLAAKHLLSPLSPPRPRSH